VALARDTNDTLAEAVRRHPDWLAGFAALPAPDPEAGADELKRMVGDHGFKGALINGHNRGRYLDDEFFWPILACAEALRVPASPVAVNRHLETPADQQRSWALASTTSRPGETKLRGEGPHGRLEGGLQDEQPGLHVRRPGAVHGGGTVPRDLPAGLGRPAAGSRTGPDRTGTHPGKPGSRSDSRAPGRPQHG
jgi:hypothetical protein